MKKVFNNIKLEKDDNGNFIINKKGITLIALVITIIVLIILAGVSINLLVGQDGLISRAKLAKEEYTNAQGKEETEVADLEYQIDMKSRETVTISKDEYNRLKNHFNYSTDEKVIGTWGNGKNLYQKTFLFDRKLVKDDSLNVSLNDVDMIMVCDEGSYVKYSANETYLSVNYTHGSQPTVGSISCTATKLNNTTIKVDFRMGGNYLTETSYLTLKQLTFNYTKTND